MVVLDKTIEIAAPPERVFALIARVCRGPEWDRGLVRASANALAPLCSGSRFSTVEEAAGLRLAKEAEAVVVDAGRRFAWRQRHGDFARHEGSYDLTPTPQGTRLRLRMHVEVPFILPARARPPLRAFLTEDELARSLSEREDMALLRLKDVLERGPEKPPG